MQLDSQWYQCMVTSDMDLLETFTFIFPHASADHVLVDPDRSASLRGALSLSTLCDTHRVCNISLFICFARILF